MLPGLERVGAIFRAAPASANAPVFGDLANWGISEKPRGGIVFHVFRQPLFV
jgi:hypothetical protein